MSTLFPDTLQPYQLALGLFVLVFAVGVFAAWGAAEIVAWCKRSNAEAEQMDAAREEYEPHVLDGDLEDWQIDDASNGRR